VSRAIDIYAPIHVPINWKSESVDNSNQRYQILKSICNVIPGVKISRVPWEFGYGSTLHDNIPIVYQPVAILTFPNINNENDILVFEVYVYDHAIAILHAKILFHGQLSAENDLWLTERIVRLCEKYLPDILIKIQDQPTQEPLLNTKKYNFFDVSKKRLTSGTPIWVSRMVTIQNLEEAQKLASWVKVPTNSEIPLIIGQGNYILKNDELFECANRSILLAQYFSTILHLTEESIISQMKNANKLVNNEKSINKYLEKQQYRQDHLSLLGILYDSAITGTQGDRRSFLDTLNRQWQIHRNFERVQKLMKINQSRLDRIKSALEIKNRRIIRSLLIFLASVSVISLLIDIWSFIKTEDHSATLGLFDILTLFSSETSITIATIAVLLFSYLASKSHDIQR